MTEIAAIVASATEARAKAIAMEQDRADRISGRALIRDEIAFLESHVVPEIEAAKAALAEAGITLNVEHEWAALGVKPKAAVTLLCRPGAKWPRSAEHASGSLVRIVCAGRSLSVTHSPRHLRSEPQAGQAVDGEPTAINAIALAVSSFLADAEARMGDTERRGSELRTSPSHTMPHDADVSRV